MHLGQMRRSNDSRAPQEVPAFEFVEYQVDTKFDLDNFNKFLFLQQHNLGTHQKVEPHSFPFNRPAHDPTLASIY